MARVRPAREDAVPSPLSASAWSLAAIVGGYDLLNPFRPEFAV